MKKITFLNRLKKITSVIVMMAMVAVNLVLAPSVFALEGVPTIAVSSTSSSFGQTVDVPIAGSDLASVGSMSFQILYDNNALSFAGYTEEALSGVGILEIEPTLEFGVLDVTWTGLEPLTIESETPLFNLRFNVTEEIPHTALILFSDGPSLKDAEGLEIEGADFVDGQVILNPTLESIAVTTQPDKINYGLNEALDITGLVVTGTYTDGSTMVEEVTADNISGFNSAAFQFGQVLTVTVGEFTTTFTVDIWPFASDKKEISGFNFSDPSAFGVIDQEALTVAISVPFGTDVTALVPSIATSAISVNPPSGVAQDFTNPVFYTVTAVDGSTATYTVTVNVAEGSAKEITSFNVPEASGATIIDGTNISVFVPFGTAVTALVPSIAITGESVSPESGVAQDFTEPVVYTVTAADGSTQEYTVTAVVQANTEKEITAFEFADLGAVGVIDGTDVSVTVPFGTDVTALVPTITVSEQATVSPESGAATDFTEPVVYTVTAGNGLVQEYTVTVTVLDKAAAPVIISVATDGLINSLEEAAIHVIGTAEAGALVSVTLSDTVNTVSGELQLGEEATEYDIVIDGTTLNDGVLLVSATATRLETTSDVSEASVTLDTVSPTVLKMGDNTADVVLGVGNTNLVFSETLSASAQAAVESALTAGGDNALTYSWLEATLTITATVATTFANDIVAAVSDLAGNSVSEILLVDSTVVVPAPSGGGGGGGFLPRTTKSAEPDEEEIELQETDVAEPFGDIEDHWAFEFIEELRLAGLIQGKTTGKFAPDSYLTRAELTKMVVGMYGIATPSSVTGKPFSDVETNAWHAVYISAAKKAGILDGYPDGTFKPDQAVSRVEALKILLEASKKTLVADPTSFSDTDATAWYAIYVNYAKASGLVVGYGNGKFGPANVVTRAEFAKMVAMMM